MTKARVFGPYRLIPSQSLLLCGETPVPIGSRALGVLTVLVEHAGSLVSKERLIAAVWPTTNVHEANLRVHIGGVRKVLRDGRTGARYIVSEAGRGYRFVAPVAMIDEPTLPLAAPASPRNPAAIPSVETIRTNLTPIIGRSEIIKSLAEQLPKRRFVTIVGPGGIGKTTVALGVVEQFGGDRTSCFVDLGPLSDPGLVGSRLASALGAANRSENPIDDIVDVLRDAPMLIVIDTCEHVLDAAAPLIEAILGRAPRVQILATSREPLRGVGEWVQRLTPLPCPEPSETLTAAQAMSYPAVQLFLERAAASFDGFEIRDGEAPILAGVCRKLDGLPLAIELAAGRVGAFGLKGLADLLERRLPLPTLGRRGAPARHRTLAATLDWSYQTLPERERTLLRRLAIFPDAFDLQSAAAASDGDENASEVVETLANLVENSLVTADLGGAQARYRLLDTTRAYALDKLRAHGEFQAAARRYAEYWRGVLERTRAEREQNPAEWVAAHREHIDDVRAALDWAFSDAGDPALGVALTLAAIPLWSHLSLNDECCARVEAALMRVDPSDPSAARMRMELWSALGGALILGRGVPRDLPVWSNALAIAEEIGDVDHQMRALYGLAAFSIQEGDFRKTLRAAEEFDELTKQRGNTTDRLVSQRMVGVARHLLGDQREARRLMEGVLDRLSPRDTDIARFQFDQLIFARLYLSGILWLLGFVDRAVRMVEDNVAHCLRGGHGASFAYALAQSACPLAFRMGDLHSAERYCDLLTERRDQYGAAIWQTFSRCYQAFQIAARGDLHRGNDILLEALAEIPRTSMRVQYVALLSALAENLSREGRLAEAGATIERALDCAARAEEGWITPEVLRVKGEIVLARGDPDMAEASFAESLDLARRQAALSWELRGATSLARLWQSLGRTEDARSLLSSVYGRFTEGFDTRDLRTACALIETLG